MKFEDRSSEVTVVVSDTTAEKIIGIPASAAVVKERGMEKLFEGGSVWVAKLRTLDTGGGRFIHLTECHRAAL